MIVMAKSLSLVRSDSQSHRKLSGPITCHMYTATTASDKKADRIKKPTRTQ